MIVCFSGTGNSRAVARRLAGQLADEVIDITADTLDNAPSIAITGTHIVWVHPVYSWGVPPVVIDFINRLTQQQGASLPHYLVCTCGDDIGLAHRQWRRLIDSRGWQARGVWSVQMPNNYTLLPGFDVDTRDVARAKLDAMPQRVDEVARLIAAGSLDVDVVEGSVPALKSRIIYPAFVRWMMSPRPFHVDADACIGCGRCSDVCPMHNVGLNSQRRPEWGRRCAMCLACYHVCPRHAVGYGRVTRGKGRYFNPEDRR